MSFEQEYKNSTVRILYISHVNQIKESNLICFEYSEMGPNATMITFHEAALIVAYDLLERYAGPLMVKVLEWAGRVGKLGRMSAMLKHFCVLLTAILFSLMPAEGAQNRGADGHMTSMEEASDLSDDVLSFVPLRALFNFPRNTEHVSTEDLSSGIYQPLTTQKRSSVSWLLAAAIRMCKDYPEQCLRQRRLHENYQKSESYCYSFDAMYTLFESHHSSYGFQIIVLSHPSMNSLYVT
ncbi:hypothetical protein CAPTEDRAFT_216497 [Capitella teleta]|uniref:Uncharacterized protein n=1 Tax=Capitella teleta TaxID=283909 RepID=R7TDY0_CAPTE|nr:hypothetical protein CAPTEDRAFT_216497 [Capitella teleta]|eukprot:ELT91963.1 hypothetical protein CAPTEDRAFT_216497 [Capitella teleta]